MTAPASDQAASADLGRDVISALVVTYNSADEVESCLRAALAQQDAGLALEIVAVDNASADDTRARVRTLGGRVRLLELPRNYGFARGVNAAYEASAGDWVLLLNPDVVMDAGCAAALREHLRDHPDVGIASALLRGPGDEQQLFARRELTLRTVLWCFTSYGRALDRRLRAGRALSEWRYAREWPRLADGPLDVDCPAAACLMLRRTDVAVRPLDERFPIFFNDGELCRRVRRAGRRIQVVPAATAKHLYGASVSRADQTRMRAEWVLSLRRYLRSELGPFRRAVLWTIFAADAALGLLRVVASRDKRAARAAAYGTLGGLGLRGGVPPWLSEPDSRPARPWRSRAQREVDPAL